MQPARNQALFLALDRDLDPVAPRRGRGNGVGAPGWNVFQRHPQREKLAGQVIKWDLPSVESLEPEGSDIVSFLYDFRQLELPHPPNLSRDRIILLVTRRFVPDFRRQRQDLHRRTLWVGRGKAFAEGEQQLWVALEANPSPRHRPNQAFLLRQKTKPRFRVSNDVNVRTAGQAILDFESAVF